MCRRSSSLNDGGFLPPNSGDYWVARRWSTRDYKRSYVRRRSGRRSTAMLASNATHLAPAKRDTLPAWNEHRGDILAGEQPRSAHRPTVWESAPALSCRERPSPQYLDVSSWSGRKSPRDPCRMSAASRFTVAIAGGARPISPAARLASTALYAGGSYSADDNGRPHRPPRCARGRGAFARAVPSGAARVLQRLRLVPRDGLYLAGRRAGRPCA